MKKIKQALHFGSMITIFFEGEDKDSLNFGRILGGLSWQTVTWPGYFCIFGEKPARLANGKKPIVLLLEGQDELPNKLFDKMIDASRTSMCRGFYGETRGTAESGFIRRTMTFNKYMKQRAAGIRLGHAYYQDLASGVFSIRQWVADDAINIPKDSCLARQLGNMTKENLNNRPDSFYAVNALRCVIGAFEREPVHTKERSPLNLAAWT